MKEAVGFYLGFVVFVFICSLIFGSDGYYEYNSSLSNESKSIRIDY